MPPARLTEMATLRFGESRLYGPGENSGPSERQLHGIRYPEFFQKLASLKDGRHHTPSAAKAPPYPGSAHGSGPGQRRNYFFAGPGRGALQQQLGRSTPMVV
jgi:hypothetical protein